MPSQIINRKYPTPPITLGLQLLTKFTILAMGTVEWALKLNRKQLVAVRIVLPLWHQWLYFAWKVSIIQYIRSTTRSVLRSHFFPLSQDFWSHESQQGESFLLSFNLISLYLTTKMWVSSGIESHHLVLVGSQEEWQELVLFQEPLKPPSPTTSMAVSLVPLWEFGLITHAFQRQYCLAMQTISLQTLSLKLLYFKVGLQGNRYLCGFFIYHLF